MSRIAQNDTEPYREQKFHSIVRSRQCAALPFTNDRRRAEPAWRKQTMFHVKQHRPRAQ